MNINLQWMNQCQGRLMFWVSFVGRKIISNQSWWWCQDKYRELTLSPLFWSVVFIDFCWTIFVCLHWNKEDKMSSKCTSTCWILGVWFKSWRSNELGEDWGGWEITKIFNSSIKKRTRKEKIKLSSSWQPI